jgi:hypothetical protein
MRLVGRTTASAGGTLKNRVKATMCPLVISRSPRLRPGLPYHGQGRSSLITCLLFRVPEPFANIGYASASIP